VASSARQPIARASPARAVLVGRSLWVGPSGIAAWLSERAGLRGKRSCPGAGGRSGWGKVDLDSDRGGFFQMGFGNEGDLRLLLADNYCLTTNDFTTELTERTEDAKRDFIRGIPAVSSIAILAGMWAAASGCRSNVAALPGSPMRSLSRRH
jgi:hypothetical protein